MNWIKDKFKFGILLNDCSYMFAGCNNITEINLITSFDTKKVKNMNYLFNEYINLKYVNISYFDIKKSKISG